MATSRTVGAVAASRAAIADNPGVLDRLLHHPQARDYALALIAGTVAESLLFLSIYLPDGEPARYLPLLFFVEAIVLGAVFGPGPGMVGAVAPLVVAFFAEWARRAFGWGGSPTGPEDTLGMVFVVLLYLAMVFAFLAGMTGAIRNRYFRHEA
jgi:hypothetical protein